MRIRLQNGLPYIAVKLFYRDHCLELDNVLLDTGSAGTVFSIDKLLNIGLEYAADDAVHRIHGVGGTEFVFSKRLERLAVGDIYVDDFEIEVGAMNYGFEMDGIVGLDFLLRVGAVIDLGMMEVHV
ncbi:MAG TPA: aspartyl protease family protein [Anaerolineae bacterium]|nr:aspartyl protease family protein [Anaerolineae bacterium]HQK12979.1 aspartyl protease family protein [Anaerolineae bacterium]